MDIHSIFNGGNVKPRATEKNIIRQYLHQTGRIQRFLIKPNIDNTSFSGIKSTQEFEQYVQKQNVFGKVFINLDLEENDWYYCELIAGNDAWISKDEVGVYRYFSKTHWGGTISMNIFDIVEIVLGDGDDTGNAFQNARNQLANMFGLDLKDEWILQQYQKYQNNLDYICGGKKDLEQAYPDVFQFIQKYRSILEYFNNQQEDGLFRIFSYREQHIFFSATNHIKEKLGISQSTVTRSVNMLVLIGFVEKIPHHKLPSRLLEISDKILNHRIANGYVGGKRITFYHVPEYSKELLEIAEQVVKTLQAAGIWGSLISKEKVIKIFGEARANEVFLAEYIVKKVTLVETSALLEDQQTPQIDLEDDPIPF